MRYMSYDEEGRFWYAFDDMTGAYVRTGILDDDGRETGEEPFMASFPHLVDVGIMGSCANGQAGLCAAAGIQCYQSGSMIVQQDMDFEDFRWIAEQCAGKVNQFALGGRGDPNLHARFCDILRTCREHGITPNYTTSGLGLTDDAVRASARYCGAVAVSWYRNDNTLSAIEAFVRSDVITNIHYVLARNTIDEALDRLRRDDFPSGVFSVVFLLHKPAGLGRQDNVLSPHDPRVRQFFEEVDRGGRSFRVGLDSCCVPGALNLCTALLPEALESCEGARFSCYIDPGLRMTPCSFDRCGTYAVQLGKDMDMAKAWRSDAFERFRTHMRRSCPECMIREACLGGCPLMPEITLCEREARQ